MAYIKQSEFVFECAKCHTRCDGVSKGFYLFEDDASFSEEYEQIIINHINATGRYFAAKCEVPGYPDIEVRDSENNVHRYLEVKVQQRAFMSIEKYLPQSRLKPSETVALNLSDLLRYFKIQKASQIKTVIVWVLKNRLCIVERDRLKLYFQTSEELEKVYQRHTAERTFRRRSGEGDVVDGVHKGVTVNYHFSLQELQEWKW
jgi:predicted nucleic-acid-binding protein